jgi:CHAT domain-containing protein
VDRMSVTVAPGFLPFAGDPSPPRGPVRASLLVGPPVRPGVAPLPGAREEVEQLAVALKTTPLLGADVVKQRVVDEIERRRDELDLIHLAMHGRASEVNPIDQSYLVLGDDHLTARRIGEMRGAPGASAGWGLARRPVVVMSACETGIGKNFAVGTIGLARAWQWAGASNVVMSLWNVDDEATRDLMIDLVGQLRSGKAVDLALREAAVRARRANRSPAYWAAFGVFGTPDRLAPP